MEMDWILGLVGGALIGLAAAMLLLLNGRIMGASGIIGGLVDGSGRHDWAERAALVIGLFAVPGLAAALTGGAETYLIDNWPAIIIAGLLVGIGTRVANGCTSGHGVCGISRLSLRGIVATVFYIGAGGLSVILVRQIWGIF